MINIIKSADRHFADHGWLQTYWHFSFSDYYDPNNMNFSVLRVFNDDIVQGGGGFPMHPHRDMEIVTYVVSGQLLHQDRLGNRGVIHPGEIQVMSAGKGIVHSEYNACTENPVHLMQLWIMPRTRAIPAWERRDSPPPSPAASCSPSSPPAMFLILSTSTRTRRSMSRTLALAKK